ncbi:MAG: L,D-transpeptidase family protein [Bacteroidia bacterium]
MDAQSKTNEEIATFAQNYTKEHYPNQVFDKWVFVSLVEQKMFVIENSVVTHSYIISGAKTGAGCKGGSNQTPTGLHHIAAKYGDDVPWGGILKARKYNGEVAQIYTDETDVKTDYVTTRILWLKGNEKGINLGGDVDSYNRYIYIHGTPEEGLLGKPASHGCIRMKNAEVIDFYSLIAEGTKVLILDK